MLHVYKDYFPVEGGIENHIRWLCTELNKTGEVEARVLVTNTGGRSVEGEIDGVKVTKVGRQGTIASTPLAVGLLPALKGADVDLVHLHFPYPFGELAYLLAASHKKMVLTYHSDIVRQRTLLVFYRPFLQRILEKAERILVSNEPYLRSSPFLHRFSDKTVVIPHGIDWRRFAHISEDEIASLRRRYGGSIVLFVGRLRYYKGLEYLIEAMTMVDGRLLIVGQGPMEGWLRKFSERSRLEDKVVFVGRVADEYLPAYYHACDVFCLPSSHRSEAYGLVLLEAMACGKAVVTTSLGTGTTFIVRDKETGLVVPPRDPQGLASALNRLLADGALRAKMGEASLQRVRSEFSLELMAERTLKLYQEVS